MSQGKIIRSNPAACPHASKCGGCQLQGMTYDRQLEFKQARTVTFLSKFGRVEEIIGMDDPNHYRNKVQAAFTQTKSGKIISGVYQSGSHSVVGTDSCMLEDEISDKIIVDIRKMLPKFKITVYDEIQGRGFLRHVLVRRGFKSGEVMVVIVGNCKQFPSKRAFADALVALHPEITTIVFNISRDRLNLVLGSRDEVLYGKGYIEDTLCGCTFRISPRSFYQVNPKQTEILYSLAMEMAELDGKKSVIDAYCGIGTIGLIAARGAGDVVGIELNGDAVRDAKANAELNGIKNAVFYKGDAGDFLTEAAESGRCADVLFMDPPRAGSTKKFIDAIGKMKPERIVYISCNPETLARDLYFITKKGYRVGRICPVDMFPHTGHIECVVSLSRKSNGAHYSEFDKNP